MSFFDRIINRKRSTNSEDHDIWSDISGLEDVKTLLQNSEAKPQLIYKHSHSCGISLLAKQELERITDKINDIAELYMINVIQQRDLSNTIASELNVRHESPQVIILKDREVIWKGSHWEVSGQDILKELT